MLRYLLKRIAYALVPISIRNDDGVDKLHHSATAYLLVLFGILVIIKEYFGQPINCWVSVMDRTNNNKVESYSNASKKHYQDHVGEYCWSHRLYHYPNSKDLNQVPYPLDQKEEDAEYIVGEKAKIVVFFSHWVSVLFLSQALCFRIPHIVWSEFNSYSGSNMMKLVEMLDDVIFIKEEEKKEKMRRVALFFEQCLKIQRDSNTFLRRDPLKSRKISRCILCIPNNYKSYLSILYLALKAMCIVNILLQYYVLSKFMNRNFWNYGTNVFKSYVNTSQQNSYNNVFQSLALCPFMTIHNGIIVDSWIQCTLTINLFLEKLFVILWLWMFTLLILTMINFCLWCMKILQTQRALDFVIRYMRLMGHYSTTIRVPETCSLRQFVTEYLRADGVFVLRIVKDNTNDIAVAGLAEALWVRYIEMHLKRE